MWHQRPLPRREPCIRPPCPVVLTGPDMTLTSWAPSNLATQTEAGLENTVASLTDPRLPPDDSRSKERELGGLSAAWRCRMKTTAPGEEIPVHNPPVPQPSRAVLCFGEPGKKRTGEEQRESRRPPGPTLCPKTLTLAPNPASTELHLRAISVCFLPATAWAWRAEAGCNFLLAVRGL